MKIQKPDAYWMGYTLQDEYREGDLLQSITEVLDNLLEVVYETRPEAANYNTEKKFKAQWLKDIRKETHIYKVTLTKISASKRDNMIEALVDEALNDYPFAAELKEAGCVEQQALAEYRRLWNRFGGVPPHEVIVNDEEA